MSAISRGLLAFAIIAIILEIGFALVYGFSIGFSTAYNLVNTFNIQQDFLHFLDFIFLIMLILIGFGLLSSYMQKSSLMNMVLIFFTLTFTFQLYFMVGSFWFNIGLFDGVGGTLGPRFNNLRISHTVDIANPALSLSQFAITDGFACALSIVVSLFALFGRIGLLQTLILCLFGTFAYSFLQGIFNRLLIIDNSYTMRIFVFGSVNGIISSLLIGKRQLTAHNPNYRSNKLSMFQGLLGAIFIVILLPWLSVVEQSFSTGTALSFVDVGFLNTWLAVTSSAMTSFAFSSILNGGKLNAQQIAFSCFTGAIAYGSSSNFHTNPFPAMVIGVITSFFSVLVNHYRSRQIAGGIWDSLSLLPSFLIPSVIGGIYSAILMAIGIASNNLLPTKTVQPAIYTNFQAGGYQMAGLGLAVGTGLACGLLSGLISSAVNNNSQPHEFFNTHTYMVIDQQKSFQE